MRTDEPSIGYLVKAAQARLNLRMEEVLAPLELTVSQYSCLFRLKHDPGISAAALARSVFMTRQSMGTMLQQLRERDLVTRPDRAESGRALPTALTADGHALVEAAEAVVDGVEARMLAELPGADRSALARALAACVAALE
ncbi:MAG: MarR family transcriptional regulator [Actinomycetales bacterium]|nr:MarR family transcriptional regulator [Actinomycetales bacterium]